MTARVDNRLQPGPARMMRLTALLLVAAFLGGCGMGTAVTNYIDSKDTNLRKRVVVAPFHFANKDLQPRAQALSQALSQAVAQKGDLALVDFAALQAALDKVSPEVRNPEERAITAGRDLGLTAVVVGVVTDLSVQYRMKGVYGFRDNTAFLTLEAQLRITDIGTGTVAGQEAFKTEVPIDDIAAEAIKSGAPMDVKLVDKLAADIVKPAESWMMSQLGAMAWTGQVLAVEGKRVQLNVGRDSGLPSGTVLTVYTVGETIKCATGQELCLPGPVAGKVRLLELGAHSSWAEAVEAKDYKNEFKTGQIVRTR